jgi:hypothetical protein
MQGLRLPAHIHYGLSGGQRIFLDLKTDRYFQLASEEEKLFEALEDGHFVAASGCAALVRTGLLIHSPRGRPIRPTEYPEPIRSLVEQPIQPVRFGLAEIFEIWFHLWRARWTVARRTLAEPRAKNTIDKFPGSVERVWHFARQFHAARKFVPLAPNCLKDSLALRRFLRCRGIGATLVIGAKLHPFAAHCWLQHGDLALNDSLSGARGFAPILVL